MNKVSPVTGQPDYPGAGWLITSGYATDAYFQRFGDWHTGHDLARSAQGGEPVFAIADGVIKWAENAGNNGFGNLVAIEHSERIYSRYAHLARIDVQRNQNVQAGTVIGAVGSTGRSTAPHLHFDISRVNNALDWPGKNKARVLAEYIDPHVWFREEEATLSVDTAVSPTGGVWLQVNAPAGLNVRTRPGTASKVEYKMPNGTIFEVKPIKFEQDGIVWRELMVGGWVAELYTLPAVVTGSPQPTQPGVGTPTPTTPVVTLPPAVAPVTVAGRGVHASAGGWAPQPRELDFVRHNRVQSALIVTYEPNQADLAIRGLRDAGVRDFIIRAATHAQITANPDEFINNTMPRLQEYQRALGGTPMIIAVHNEPNIDREGLTRAWQNGGEFAQWYIRVVQAYRNAFPGCKIGFPAMSPGGDVDIPGVVKRMDEWRFVEQARAAIDVSDWIGVHAYFVGDGLDIDLKPAAWRNMARGRSIIVTEGGPADNIPNTGQKLHNTYTKCEAAGFPVMAWLLEGAGGWGSAEWVKNNVRI
jgi:hypothetical protein